jgi:hypothetical protein
MMSMTENETYNGYANRETWAFNLHWSSDQGLYNETLEQARELVRVHVDSNEELSASMLGEHIVCYWRDTFDEYEGETNISLPEPYRMFDREVGSWWRIDYAEVGASVRESLES